ncbi:MAG: DUF2341 domain-containing protein [Candidatus Thorarchaeota archaeon]|jgi:uncharacterized repeat protein (TIGR01451 family)
MHNRDVFTTLVLLMLVVSVPAMMFQFGDDGPQFVDDKLDYLEHNFTPAQWLPGYDYRKSHAITGTSGAGTNYQVKVIVHYGSGTDGGENVYLNSNCQIDFDDIRFTDDDGVTQLDYWIEDYVSGEWATFWVEVADNLDTDQTIYLDYGNPIAVSESSGDDTFIMYEDWSTASWSSMWIDESHDGGGTTTWYATDALHGNIAEMRGGINNAGIGMKYNLANTASTAMLGRVNIPLTSTSFQRLYVSDGYTGIGPWAAWHSREGVEAFVISNDADVSDSLPVDSSRYGTYQKFQITRDGTNAKLWFDDGLGYSTAVTVSCTPDTESGNLGPYLYARDTEYALFVDYVAVRKYISNEPAHSEWGVEESSGWLSGWDNRKEHTINGAAGAGTNYQVKVVVHYGSGTDSGENVYLNSNCQTDFDDIRFTVDDGTALDYWREDFTSSNQAVFWVEISESLDVSQSVYIYYGNPSVLTTSSGTDTFLLFDNFDSSLSSSLWEWDGASVSGGELQIEADSHYIKSSSTFGPNVAIEARTMMGGNRRFNQGFGDVLPFWNNSTHVLAHNLDGNSYIKLTSLLAAGTPLSYSANTWTILSLNWADGYSELWKNRGSSISMTHSNVPSSSLYAGFNTWGTADSVLHVDWVFVRKHVDAEPTHSVWGVEESQSGQTTPSTPTTTPTAAIDSMMLIASFGGVGIISLIAAFVIIRSRRKSKLRSEFTTQIRDEKPPPRVPREVATQQTMTPQSAEALRAILAAAATPRMIERKVTARKPGGPIQVATGFDAAGENLKLAVKVNNTGEFIVTNVQVILDVPDGFDYVKGTSELSFTKMQRINV